LYLPVSFHNRIDHISAIHTAPPLHPHVPCFLQVNETIRNHEPLASSASHFQHLLYYSEEAYPLRQPAIDSKAVTQNGGFNRSNSDNAHKLMANRYISVKRDPTKSWLSGIAVTNLECVIALLRSLYAFEVRPPNNALNPAYLLCSDLNS
jgi:hypothetical protein